MATQLFETIVSLQRQKIEQMQAQSKSKTTFFLSKEIIVLPTVFSPGSDTELLAQNIPITQQDIILEPCAGTGAISLYLAQTAKYVFATDINPQAVRNIQLNAQLHNLEHKLTAIKADLFPYFSQKYNIIVINPPYTNHHSNNVVEQAFWDKDHKTLLNFLHRAQEYLLPNGKIYLSWANFADFLFLETAANKAGYNLNQKAELIKDIKMYRIYELTLS